MVVKSQDHDFHPDSVLTHSGVLLVEQGELFVSMVTSKVASDCIVDDLQHMWTSSKARFPKVGTLLLDLDNGPENNSHRTQFIQRLVQFADENQVNVRLVYYPPYHSKYNHRTLLRSIGE